MQDQPLQLKGSRLSIFVLEIIIEDTEALCTALQQRVEQAPQLFNSAPIIIHSKIETINVPLLERLVKACIEYQLSPVLIQLDVKTDIEMIAGIYVRGADACVIGASNIIEPPLRDEGLAEPEIVIPKAPLIIDKLVRSGQQIYAKGRHLVVMSSVSEGAELIADGDIHVYGTLRGRAIAGASGNEASRIFCLQCYAELVSIAGNYKVQEQIEEAALGSPVMIELDGQSMNVNYF